MDTYCIDRLARSARFHADVEFAWTATLFGGASAVSEAFPPCDQGMADVGKLNSFAHAKRTFLVRILPKFLHGRKTTLAEHVLF